MTLQQTKHAPAILRHFDGIASPAFFDIFADVLERALDNHEQDPKGDIGDHVSDAINDEIIYCDDQWEILKQYQTPEKADWLDAVDFLYIDLCAVASEIIDNQ